MITTERMRHSWPVCFEKGASTLVFLALLFAASAWQGCPLSGNGDSSHKDSGDRGVTDAAFADVTGVEETQRGGEFAAKDLGESCGMDELVLTDKYVDSAEELVEDQRSEDVVPAGEDVVAPENCETKQCGNNGAGSDCGSCAEKSTCGPFNMCVPACVPDCEGKECGPDGCGGKCGECGSGFWCNSGACGEECIPICSDPEDGPYECGPNDCGSFCGECAPGTLCIDHHCPTCCQTPPDCVEIECGIGDPKWPAENCGSCAEGKVCGEDNACVSFSPSPSPVTEYLRCMEKCQWDAPNYDLCQWNCIGTLTEEAQQAHDALQACVADECAGCFETPGTVIPCLSACLFGECQAPLLEHLGSSGPLSCSGALACHSACEGESLDCMLLCLEASQPSGVVAFLDWLQCYKAHCPHEPACHDAPKWDCYMLPSLQCYFSKSKDECSEPFNTCISQ